MSYITHVSLILYSGYAKPHTGSPVMLGYHKLQNISYT